MANPRKAPRPSKGSIKSRTNIRLMYFLATHQVTKKTVNRFLESIVRSDPNKGLQTIADDFQQGKITAAKALMLMRIRLESLTKKKNIDHILQWTMRAGDPKQKKPWAFKMTDLEQYAKGVTPEQEKAYWGP